MDHFGIGAGMLGAAQTYAACSRRTGRTLSLIESVKAGDRIVFTSATEAKRVKSLIAERAIEVECVVASVEGVEHLLALGTGKGRTLFDHGWVEARYLHVLKHTADVIDNLEQNLSGEGANHRETRRLAIELAKWRFP